MTFKTILRATNWAAGLFCCLALPFVPHLHGRDKTDVIIFKNGDRITCEIKGLSRGQLNIKTDYAMGTIAINWEKIERIETDYHFQVETEDGRRLTGKLQKESTAPGSPVVITRDSETTQVPQSEVVLMRPIGSSFLRRLDGSISYGFTFARDNTQVTSSLSSSVKYDTTGYALQVLTNSQFSDQADGTSSNRQNTSLVYKKYLRRKKFYGAGYLDFLKSNQQQLDLRTTIGAGLGRSWIKSNRTIFATSLGLVGTRERFSPDSGSPPQSTNLEGLVALEFSTFRFDSTEFTTTFVLFPSLSRAGRIRANLDSMLKLDLIGDLYWNVTFYQNFDSAPPANTPKNDFGVTTGVGWSF